MSLRRKCLYGFTAIVLLALTVLPATGWLIRSQVASTFGLGFSVPDLFSELSPEKERPKQFAREHPADIGASLFILQYDFPRTQRIAALQAKHPDNLMVNAVYLRIACDLVYVGHASQQNSLYAKPVEQPYSEDLLPDKNRPEDLAHFVKIAAESEALDPENAYFPLMQAVGLLAQNRDKEAIATLKRASEKKTYNDYVFEDTDTRWQTANAMYGQEVGSIGRTAVIAATLYPNFADLRTTARTMTGLALEQEQQGNKAEGLAIRKAVARVGALMRADASSQICNLVGGLITNISLERPGGAAATPTQNSETKEQEQVRLDAYVAYLNILGEKDEATYIQAEVAAQRQGQAIQKKANEQSWFFYPDIDHLIPLWLAGSAVQSSILGVLLLGGIFGLLNRFSRRLRAGEPMASETRWGIALALTTTVCALIHPNVLGSIGYEWYLLWLVPGAILLIAPLVGRFRAIQWGKGLGTMALTFLVVGLLACVSYFPMRGILNTLSLLLGWGWMEYKGQPPFAQQLGAVEMSLASLLTLSLLLLISLAIMSRVLKVPVSVGVTRSYHRLAGPVICLLLLGYAGLIAVTAHEEQKTIHALNAIARHEGHYMAHITGTTWPGVTPAPVER